MLRIVTAVAAVLLSSGAAVAQPTAKPTPGDPDLDSV